MTRVRKLLLLVQPTGASSVANDNAERIPPAFTETGWSVTVQSQADLREHNGRVSAGGCELNEDILIWHLGLGQRNSFLDRMQMLSVLPDSQFVTSPRALLALHGKFHWQAYGPETFVSGDADWLLQQRHRGTRWIIKPSAGSFGRGVTWLTGNDEEDLASLRKITDAGSMAILQKAIDRAAEGEIRTLVAAGTAIASYRRTGAGVNNLAAGARATAAQLSTGQRQIVGLISEELVALRVGFAAIDLIGETLVEVNIANPGGLATLAKLGDIGAAERLACAFANW